MGQKIGLALQGGGAHGAFTWGVLDRLLDEVGNGSLEIASVSGTSAGAINGALCAYGLSNNMSANTAEQTQELLAKFWRTLSTRAFLSGNPFSSLTSPTLFSGWNIDWHPMALAMGMLSLIFSPYDRVCFDNPLLEILEEFFSTSVMETLNHPGSVSCHVCAVNVGTNQRKVFKQPNISIDALLASACLPSQFRAVEIDNKVYWDGGYIGNPALAPLVKACDDIIVVMLNPMRRADIPPRSSMQILDRLNEISFNSPLVLEINAIHAVNRLIHDLPDKIVQSSRYRKIRLHFIRNDAFMAKLGFVGKDNLAGPFLDYLFDAGRTTAEKWLINHRKDIGVCSTASWKKKSEQFDMKCEILDPMLKGD